ncbi:SMP-30/gluconolactonase/LRE family protein [Rhizobium sp. CRIBSB]|nr:SMP-30/gluconolactonase/LRE family protein [Rhizobium sp. CRIBSB]
MSGAELVWDLRAELGEGPVWDGPRGCLWFVDIKGRRLHRYTPATDERASWDAPDQIGFALPAEDGSLVCGVRGGLYRFDIEAEDFSLFQPVETDRPQNRLNDGFVAPDGSLWFGSMDDSEEQATGALYRWYRGDLARHDDGYGVTNGPCLSPDGRTLYHHDTLARTVLAFDHDGGVLSNRRVFAMTEDGFADGPSMDAEGVLHVGLFNGWGVARFSPSGQRIGKIEAPVQTVTKAAFGGEDLRDLYMTTAWLGNADKRDAQPTLGGLYRVRVETPGLTAHRIAL